MTRHQEKKTHSHKHAELQMISTISDNNKIRQSDFVPSSTNPPHPLSNKRVLSNKTSLKTSTSKILSNSSNSSYQNKIPLVSSNSSHQNKTPSVSANNSPHKNKTPSVSVHKNKTPPVSPTKKITASQLTTQFGNIRLSESFQDIDDEQDQGQGTPSQ
ncbi:6463_t:CDS:1, partial [Funneliformis caledonium]